VRQGDKACGFPARRRSFWHEGLLARLTTDDDNEQAIGVGAQRASPQWVIRSITVCSSSRSVLGRYDEAAQAARRFCTFTGFSDIVLCGRAVRSATLRWRPGSGTCDRRGFLIDMYCTKRRHTRRDS